MVKLLHTMVHTGTKAISMKTLPGSSDAIPPYLYMYSLLKLVAMIKLEGHPTPASLSDPIEQLGKSKMVGERAGLES